MNFSGLPQDFGVNYIGIERQSMDSNRMRFSHIMAGANRASDHALVKPEHSRVDSDLKLMAQVAVLGLRGRKSLGQIVELIRGPGHRVLLLPI
jgi:hypothetical protein